MKCLLALACCASCASGLFAQMPLIDQSTTAATTPLDSSVQVSVRYPDGRGLTFSTHDDQFPRVVGSANSAAQVTLRLPLGRTALMVIPLDGGTSSATAQPASVDAVSGNALVTIAPGGKPGTYRFLVNDGVEVRTLSVVVPDPQHPEASAGARQPQ